MTRLRFIVIVLAMLILISASSISGLLNGAARGDEGEQDQCTIMHPSPETLRRWVEAYNSAPEVSVSVSGFQLPSPMGSLDLLDHLQYDPDERSQGSCGNCWAWAGIGVMEIALDVQNGIKDRLSIQYLNSNYNGGTGESFACCGGSLAELESFYAGEGKAIPWSNTNAYWQDGSQSCGGSTSVPAGDIDTTPYYDINSINEVQIPTQNLGEATAIASIKYILDQNKAAWFAFYLPTSADWSSFYSFWNNQSESAIWDPDYSCGHTWESGGGGAHAVLCVGYNDDTGDTNDYWIMLNSWGTASGGRPNGLFRLDMHMNYDCTFYLDPYWYYGFYWETLDITYSTPQTAINIVGKGSDDPVSQIVFPPGLAEAVISSPYNDVDTVSVPQVVAASDSEPVVRLYNASSGELEVWLDITGWTGGAVASERYKLVAEGTNVSVVNDVLSEDGTAKTVDTNATIASGDWLELYLEVVLSSLPGVSGDSTLTILGEFLP